MRRFGLIGFPLTHSFSKTYFNKKFAAEMLSDCHYDMFPIESIYELPELVDNTPELMGLNVTIPYKQLVIDLLDDKRNLPRGLDACNCIKIRQGRLIGYNTDIYGFENSLTPLLKPQHKKALVLGTGGAAKAVCFVLEKLGIEYARVSRTANEHGTYLYRDLLPEIVFDHKLIVNCTPVGMYPHLGAAPAIPYASLSAEHLLYDLVYNPGITQFLQKGAHRGAKIKNGLEMLQLQAEGAWRIWNED